MTVLVRFARGVEVRRCFGTADPSAPMREDTVFQVLSLSKPVTALCALSLVECGVLDLDEPVWQRIRSWRLPPHRFGCEAPDGITLRRLLSHSAGLNVHGYGWAQPGEIPGPAELLTREDDEARTLRVVIPPGSGLRYSGGGFVLVQLLVEDATGLPFPQVARERVLRPLGMESSGFELPPDAAARLATRHDEQNLPLPAARLAAVAASGLYSTADDLARLWAALAPGAAGEPAGRGVVSPTMCAQMLTSQIVGEDGTACGLGVFLKRKRSDVRYTQSGYFPGWYCHAEGLLRRRVVFVVLSNGDRGKECVPEVARALRRTLYDTAPHL